MLIFSEFVVIDQSKRSGLTRSAAMKHHGS